MNWPCKCSTKEVPLLPHTWIAGDDEMGRSSWFRGELRQRQRALLAGRSLQHAGPPDGRRASGLQRSWPPSGVPFQRVDKWCAALPATAWTKIEVRDAEKGPLVVEVVAARVTAKTGGHREGPEELLFVIRERRGRTLSNTTTIFPTRRPRRRSRSWLACKRRSIESKIA